MTDERWQRIKELFERALDQPLAARAAFLKHSDETPSIVADVKKLIDADERADDFLQDAGLPSEPAIALLRPGDLINEQFRIVSLLGRGGMGLVYEADDLTLSRPVALKFVHTGTAGSTHYIERLKREARAAAALNHPNICVVHETGDHQGQPFIVMELLEGQTLKNRIAAGPLEIGEFLDWSLQIISGLEAAHQARIVHRDIKPGNIFLTKRGQAKILDFGLAKVVPPSIKATNARTPSDGDLTIPGVAVGTVRYMSPEQARGETLDGRSDLYSFGAVLYEMATGRLLFDGGFVTPSSINPRLPRDLDRIINKALEANPDLRYQQAADMCDDLARLKEVATHLRAREEVHAGRRIRSLLFVTAGIIAVGALLMLWQRMRSVVGGDHHEIVLADFDSFGSDSELNKALNTAMAIDLNQSPFLLVASSTKVGETLKLMERSPRETLTPALAREVCQRINDQAVLSGGIARVGQKYLITLTASDCASGADLAQSKAVANDPDNMLAAVDSVAADMRKRLGEPLESLHRFNTPLLPKETGSLEALKAYSRAHELGVNGDYQKSIPFFKRAIELDPRFAIAYADLGVVYSNLGESDLAAANCKKAYALRNVADEPDRLFIIAQYHEQVTGDLHESIRNYQTWTETYPADSSPWANLADLETQIGRPDLALAPAAQACKLSPKDAVTYVILARAQMHAGQAENAGETCRQAVAQGLDGAQVHGLLAQLAFARRDYGAFADQIAWAKGKSAETYMALQGALAQFAEGKRHAAVETLRLLADEYRKQGMLERANRVLGGIPRIEAELGLVNDARSLLQRLPSIDGSTDIPVALAEIGEEAKAEEILQGNLRKYPDNSLWQDVRGPQIKAAIALSQHKPEEAIAALQPGIPYDLRSFDLPAMRGRAYLAAKQPQLAAIEFLKIIDNPTVDPLSHDVPLAHLGLARAYALEGRLPASVEEYKKFFALWKEADPDMPLLKEARLEFARLPG